VPVFEPVSFKGCLFGQHLLRRSAQRLIWVRDGEVQLKPTRVRTGSFALRNLAG
jgi:hypothetical protein